MKGLSRKNLTYSTLEQICNYIQPNSELKIINNISRSFEEKAKDDLNRLINKNILNKKSHLQQGISRFEYDNKNILIQEIPLQYPDQRLLKDIDQELESKNLVGPMTGVFVHVFQEDVYSLHVRGQEVAAPGKIQIVAGMGEYRIYPADNAIKEIKEELGINAKLIFPHNRFLDIVPFLKAGRFVQPLFSYIATGDLSQIRTVVKKEKELEKFVASLPENKLNEAYPFLVPMENLRDFLTEIDQKDKFYGPVKRTALNFLSWYNKEFDKDY